MPKDGKDKSKDKSTASKPTASQGDGDSDVEDEQIKVHINSSLFCIRCHLYPRIIVKAASWVSIIAYLIIYYNTYIDLQMGRNSSEELVGRRCKRSVDRETKL